MTDDFAESIRKRMGGSSQNTRSGPDWTVTVSGSDIGRLEIDIDTTLPGKIVFERGTLGGILGELEYPATIRYKIRVAPQDPRDVNFRGVIANMSFAGVPADSRSTAVRPEEVERFYVSHLEVEETKRREGYGSMMWDTLVATAQHADVGVAGGIGSGGGATERFLRSKGVPASDIRAGSVTRWDTELENVL